MRPSYIHPGQVGRCFDECIIASLKYPDLRYVEGVAEDPLTPGRWILHGWLTDGTHAFDVTWRTMFLGNEIPIPTTYIGFELDTKQVAKFMRDTGWTGFIANAHRYPKWKRRLLPRDFPQGKIEDLHTMNIPSFSPQL